MSAVVYDAPPTLRRFMASDAFVRFAIGPVGSGKSSACVVEILSRAMRQRAGPDAVRRTRWAVVRNSYRELKDTTRRTFEQWAPAGVGSWREADFTYRLQAPLADGTRVDCEVLFRALDRPEDVKKLLSLEVTGCYFNEVREIPKAIFDMMKTRVGRYPSKREGGPSWVGIWGDSNPWHTQHWAYSLFKKEIPGHEIYRQPSGRAKEAENLENLPAGYYDRLIEGQDSEWVKVYVDGEDASTVVGSIWGEAISALGDPDPFDHGNGDVFTSWDLGRSDSTSIWFWKLDGRDRVRVIDHYENHLKPLSHYFELLATKPYAYRTHWLPHDARARTLASEMSVEDQFRRRYPGQVQIGPGLTLSDGIQAARWLLEKRVRFHARCKAGIAALAAYRREWDEEARSYSSQPVHDWSSHTADAFRYLAVVVKVTGLIAAEPEPKPTPGPPTRSLGSFTLDELWAAQSTPRRQRV